MFLIGVFYLMTTVTRLRRAARSSARRPRRRSARAATSPRRPRRGARRRRGHVGGDLFLAIIAGVAFATILAVVAGPRASRRRARSRTTCGRTSSARAGTPSTRRSGSPRSPPSSIGAIAIAIAIIGGEGLNVSFMVGLAFAVAASANFPALLLALTWRRFNTTGAVTGVLFGVISSIALVIDQPDGVAGPRLRGRRAVVVRRSPTRGSSRSRSGSSAAGSARCWRESAAPSARSTSCTCAPRPASAPSRHGPHAHRRWRQAPHCRGGHDDDDSPLVVPSGTTWPEGLREGA